MPNRQIDVNEVPLNDYENIIEARTRIGHFITQKKEKMKVFLLTLILMSVTGYAIAQVPTAPTNFTVTASNGQMTLSWDLPSNEGSGNHIRYERSIVISGSADQWLTATVGDKDERTVTVAVGQNGITYTCKVRMVTSVGNGAAASTTVTPTLDAPANFTATASDGQVSLQWDSVTDASRGYQYKQGTGSWTPSTTPFISGTSKTITGLTNGTPYTFAVRGINDGLGGSSSPTKTVTPTHTCSHRTYSRSR